MDSVQKVIAHWNNQNWGRISLLDSWKSCESQTSAWRMEKEKHVRFRILGMQRRKKNITRKPGNLLNLKWNARLKWQADWHLIQSVVDLLHRIDGIVSVVTGYSLIIFFFLPLSFVLFNLARFWFRRALSTSAVTKYQRCRLIRLFLFLQSNTWPISNIHTK